MPHHRIPITVHVPFAIRLYGLGLQQLQDPNWTGILLYDILKQYMHRRSRAKPEGVFYKTLERGVLWILGTIFYDDLTAPEGNSELAYITKRIRGEYQLWHLDDIVKMLAYHNHKLGNATLHAAVLVERYEEIFDRDEELYFAQLEPPRALREL